MTTNYIKNGDFSDGLANWDVPTDFAPDFQIHGGADSATGYQAFITNLQEPFTHRHLEKPQTYSTTEYYPNTIIKEEKIVEQKTSFTREFIDTENELIVNDSILTVSPKKSRSIKLGAASQISQKINPPTGKMLQLQFDASSTDSELGDVFFVLLFKHRSPSEPAAIDQAWSVAAPHWAHYTFSIVLPDGIKDCTFDLIVPDANSQEYPELIYDMGDQKAEIRFSNFELTES
ncbi:hypothetical protein KDX38_19750 [Pseudomonas sp. CDFA 602]|uniref:hypothetical protein n=1 Tax=Pseudomonas californiensis TaxID=2829823 RepID=UPI001E4C3480|nr:hypothetical protein [Pseudomonas californiensis]MCD5995926.1 hypothetical protein [Pseudomonas californiensis]MCD6001438.1 hypothetical protein [Pseudomonas californiensis]